MIRGTNCWVEKPGFDSRLVLRLRMRGAIFYLQSHRIVLQSLSEKENWQRGPRWAPDIKTDCRS
jgi:hypothetical protein